MPPEKDSHPIHFYHIAYFYANIVDYFRLLLCVAATFTVCYDIYPFVSAGLLLATFWLDIYDGKIARYFKQCSILGDGLDWTADLYIDVLLTIWWGRLEPSFFPFMMILTMIEVMAAIFDFALLACDRFPRRPTSMESGFNIILRWGMPNQSWSRLGWIIWLSYAPYMIARILYLTVESTMPKIVESNPPLSLIDALPSLLALPSAAVSIATESSVETMLLRSAHIFCFYVQLALFVPWALFQWSNIALLKSSLQRWTEKRKPGQVYPALKE